MRLNLLWPVTMHPCTRCAGHGAAMEADALTRLHELATGQDVTNTLMQEVMALYSAVNGERPRSVIQQPGAVSAFLQGLLCNQQPGPRNAHAISR
jgi:hypothetical protein